MTVAGIECTVLIFDAGNTLIFQTPATEAMIADFLAKELDIDCRNEGNHTTAKICVRESELWAGRQGEKEANGAPRISDEQFIIGMYGAGIEAVSEGLARGDIEIYAKTLGQALTSRGWIADESAAQVLEALSARGFRLALVSNFSTELRSILKEYDLDRFFESIIISDEVGIRKPDPRIMELLFDELSVTRESCLYIGDHPYDVVCAKAAGMYSCWLNPDSHEMPAGTDAKPDIEIGSLEELVK